MRPTCNSGATGTPGQQTDAVDPIFGFEHKYTSKDSYSVSRGDLEKLVRQASDVVEKIPVFGITFVAGEMSCNRDWVVLPWEWFLAFKDCVERLDQVKEVLNG